MKIQLLNTFFAVSALFSCSLFGAHQRTVNANGSIEYAFDFTPTKIILTEGNINTQPVEAIVNAANEQLQHGGGVAAAISKAAGPALQQWSNDYYQQHGPLAIGAAVISPAFNLTKNGIKYIMHTVGPRGNSTDREAKLQQTYVTCLHLAQTRNITSIAIPAISTKIFGYPIEQATPVALKAIIDYLKNHQPQFPQTVYLVTLGNDDTGTRNFVHYQNVLDHYCTTNNLVPTSNPKTTLFSFTQLLQSPKLWIPTIIIATVVGSYLWWRYKKLDKNKKNISA